MTIGIQWPLVLFTLIAGTGSGLLAATALATLVSKQDKKTMQFSLVSVIVLLGIGGLMSVFHLAHPERFMGAIANLLSFSGIALELIGLALNGIVALLFLYFASTEKQSALKVTAICAIVVGVIATLIQGYAYFEVAAQAGWHTIALPLCYMLTSLTTGSLVFIAIASYTAKGETDLRLVGIVAVILAGLATLALAAYFALLGSAGLLQDEAVVLAILTLVVELAALALTAYFIFKKASPLLAVVAAICALGGGLLVRVVMWLVASYGLNVIWEAAANRGLYLF